MVSGRAVNDIVHLVAELLDNATAYSNPESEVKLSARFAGQVGLTIEIGDAGAGIPLGRLAAINERLADPPAVDVGVSRQMGLFVVGRLAKRHGITVHLSSAGEGSGVTVTVTLPAELLTGQLAAPLEREYHPEISPPQPEQRSTVGYEQGREVVQPPAPTVGQPAVLRRRYLAATSGCSTTCLPPPETLAIPLYFRPCCPGGFKSGKNRRWRPTRSSPRPRRKPARHRMPGSPRPTRGGKPPRRSTSRPHMS